MSTRRGFCRWLVAEGELASDPSAQSRHRTPRLEAQAPGADGAGPGHRGRVDVRPQRARSLARARPWWWLYSPAPAYAMGEATGLRVNDVEARDHSPRLRVYGKGGRRRVIPVGVRGNRSHRRLHDEPAGASRWLPRHRGAVRALRRPALHPRDAGLPGVRTGSGGQASLPHRDRWPTPCAIPTPPCWWTTAPSRPEMQRLLGHRDLSTTRST